MVKDLAGANFEASGGIRPAVMLIEQLRFRGSTPVVLIKKTIHLIDDGRQDLGILLALSHLLQTSPAFGFV